MMTFSAIRGAQIIDVTKECTFEWSQYVPDTITAGTFPDSIISRDLDDYLEFEKTLTGAGYLGRLMVKLHRNMFFIPVIVAGVGEKVDENYNGEKRISGVVYEMNSLWNAYVVTWQRASTNNYNSILATQYPLGVAYGAYLIIAYYVNNQGTYRGRFHNIRILEVKI